MTDDVKRPARRILIVRLSALGDVVNSLPVASAIKEHRPGTHVTWLVEDRMEAIVRACPDVDEVIVFPRRRLGLLRIREALRYCARLRRESFDAILDLQGNLKSGVHLLFLRGGERIGFAAGHNRERNHAFTNRRVRPARQVMNRVDKYLSLLRALGIAHPQVRYRIEIPREVRDAVRADLAAIGAGDRSIVMHPGTSRRGILKRWRPERYAELGVKLARETGAGILLTWGGDEIALANEIAERMNGAAHVAPKTASLLHLAAILQGARLFIGADSGPLHLAAALGTRCVALFGPKDPAIYAPHGEGHQIVYKGVECSPCRRTVCDHHKCMEMMTTDDVLAAARKAMKR